MEDNRMVFGEMKGKQKEEDQKENCWTMKWKQGNIH